MRARHGAGAGRAERGGRRRIAAALAAWTALAAVAAPSSARAKDGAWETVSTSPYLIKTRSVPGTDIKEIWAEGELDAPVQDIQATVMDPDRYSKFMPFVKESRTFGDVAEDGAKYAYTRLDFGSLASSRDYVVKVYLLEGVASDGTGEFRNKWVADPDKLPRRNNVIRLRVNEGSWHVRPSTKDPNKSKATYRFLVDPGGWIPSFVANMGNKQGVTDTFRAVEKEAQRRMAERQPESARR